MSAPVARILVVDDNPATCYATSRVLSAAGYAVVAAIDGAQALSLARGAIDLVILDINLPDIDGFEVARRLRIDPRSSRLPIVHLSATLTGDANKAEGLAAGSDSYLEHPVEPQVLLGTVRAFLRTRRAEEIVRASEARFRGVFDLASNGIMLTARTGVCLEANPAMCQILGRTREELVGMNTIELQVFDEATVGAVSAIIDTEGTWQGYLPLLRGDGSIAELEWRISQSADSDLRVAVATDIGDRRRLESAREDIYERERAARAEAERVNRIKDEFLATLSHELRNPLNAIVGWANVLLRSGVTDDLKQAVVAIDRNARMQAQLISDLLDVSRIASGKLDLERNPLRLDQIVAAALQSVQPMAAAKGVHLQAPAVVPVTVDGDSARLQQVLWNLLSNAVKFTPAGGIVTVAISEHAGSAVVTVSDTGKGVSADFLPHIFERFRQEQSDSRKSYSGLGLGLAIAQHLVGLHGGNIEAQSDGEGCGARFVVTLPQLSGVAIEVQPEPTVAPAARLDGIRVLVVDDDADTRALMMRLLGDAGAEVGESDHVAHALEMLENFEPQVLVSDIGMAVRDGYDLIRKVRETRPASALPAVAVTAFARAEDRQQALQAGFQEHLTKPIDAHQMLGLVAKLVRR